MSPRPRPTAPPAPPPRTRSPPWRRPSRLAALLRRLAPVVAAAGLAGAYGHAVEVRQCFTPDGNLRFFVEHWHGTLSSPSEAKTMKISEELTGQSAVTETKSADGIFNNKDITTSLTGWGCIDDVAPTVVRSCRNHSSVRNKEFREGGAKNDWVFYVRPLTCNVEVKYTLLAGDSEVLRDGCSEDSQEYLYNAVIGPETFQDTSAPVPKINGNVLDQTITVIADSPDDPKAIVTFEATATDDCDTSPNVTTSHASTPAFDPTQ